MVHTIGFNVTQPVVQYAFNNGQQTTDSGGTTQVTWLEDPPPWLSPAYCFASVIVWTENKHVTISDRFICFILTVKRRWRPVFWRRQLKKRSSTFLREKVHLGDLAGGFSDLEMTWLLYCAGAATDYRPQAACCPWTHFNQATTTFWTYACLLICSLRCCMLCTACCRL